MKRKGVMAVICGLLTSALLAGCGQTASDNTAKTAENTKEASKESSDQASQTEDIVTLKLAMFTFGDNPDIQEVQDEVNKITREKIGTEIEFTLINSGSWIQQTNMMLASGGEIDIMPVGTSPITTYVGNGQIIPLDDLLEEYGQGIKEVIEPEYLDCGKVGGKLYGLTTNRDLASTMSAVVRKDLCEKYNIDYENITTLEQLGDALKVIKENEPAMYPIVSHRGGACKHWGWDSLGTNSVDLGVLMDNGDSLTVENLYETEEFKDFCDLMRSWYLDELIMPDAVNNTETAVSLIKADRAFGFLTHTKPGYDIQATGQTGYEMAVIDFIEPLSVTSDVQFVMWSITNTCANPEKAMQFLNLAYTDADLSNLLVNGIEGKHYVIKDEENGIIGFPDGVTDRSTSGYYGGTGYAWPNQFLTYVWEGNEPDYWEQLDAYNKSAHKSKALGYAFDVTPVQTEYAACKNVVDKYRNALMFGAVDPEETLEKMNTELYEAGLQRILDEKQSQLDTWLAEQ